MSSTTVDMKVLKALTAKALQANKGADRATAKAVVISAEAVYRVTSAGVIGQEGSPWPSQNAYAAAIGVSGGRVTGLKRIGLAVVHFGVDPTDARFGLLTNKAGTAEVGEILAKKGQTAEGILSACDDLFGDAAKAKAKAAAKKKAAETKAKKSADAKAEKEATKAVKTLADARAALASLVTLSHDWSVKDQEKWLTLLDETVKAGHDRLATLGEKAGAA